MDIKQQLINDVLFTLNTKVDTETLKQIECDLIVKLNDYEISEKCTSIATIDNSVYTAMNKFIATKRIEGKSENTLKRYYYENMRLINFLNKNLDEITTYDIRFYLSYRREKSQRKLSERTLDGMRRCFSSFFSWLNSEGIISRNPCDGIKQIKYKKSIKKPYTQQEIERMRRLCRSKRDLALIDFLYCTGCRVSEIVNINIADIDFDRLECIVQGKGNKERYVYLSQVAVMTLKEYIESRSDFSEALFVGKGTERLSKGGIENIIHKLAKNADIKDAYPHKFRRTLATNLLDKGMNIQNVAEILGHADLKTTQIYCYMNRENVRNSYNKYI